VTLYVVRHARAGSRQHWKGDDRLRPLSKVGRAQAEALAKSSRRTEVDAVLSSPYVRCLQTVEPFAARRHLPVEPVDDLAEGAEPDDVVQLLAKVSDRNVVLCTHGDVMDVILRHAAAMGVKLPARRAEKASTWVFEVEDGTLREARYVKPPKRS
jgi:8-oxo-dGTP diphosphatase